jgi:hypothetical protein
LNEENEAKDKVKTVEMTIYPETGYSGVLLSDVWIEPMFFSESDDSEKRLLTNIITEGFDFEYERGYKYTFKAEKVWMANPPQDVSSIKYVFVGDMKKEKVITEDKEEALEVFVESNTVKFVPCFPIEYDAKEKPKVYDALLVRETKTTSSWVVLKEIEGFNFENGYEYVLNVKKITEADPYMIRYILLDTKDKQKI